MASFEVSENPKYIKEIRKFEVDDPGHADLINSVVQALVNNDAFLKYTIGNKADTASPTLTGTPKAPTPASTENSTRIATTAYVKTVVNALVNGAPETLDTLKEIADAIAEHKEVMDALNAAIGNKVDKVSGKGLSTNDFTTALKNKLTGIATGAEVNVQADWNETNSASDAYIKNKPNIPEGVAVDSALSSTSTNPVQNKAVYTELGKKANLASPTLTGTPKAPTPASTENSTRIATTAFVKTVVNALVNGAPEMLDTLKEIADAIAEHKEVTDALNAAIGNKVDKVSGKGLSTNDFTTALKNKLLGIATGAEVNVQADWEETNASSDAYIKNKPSYSGKPKAGAGTNNSCGYIAYPSDGGSNFSTSIGAGYLRITLPISWENIKIKFIVSIFENKIGGSTDYIISGYLHPTGKTWMSYTAVCIGKPGTAQSNLPVAFGHNGEKCTVTIGNSDTAWNFACAQVHDIMFENTSVDFSELTSGWAVEVNPEALPVVQGTVADTNISNRWATARNINGMSIAGDANRHNFTTCTTAAATTAKTAACTGFLLAAGSEITVRFTYGNTASSPTLNVNSTGAKPIFYRGAPIPAEYLGKNHTYTFRYNGAQWELVGDINDGKAKWDDKGNVISATYARKELFQFLGSPSNRGMSIQVEIQEQFRDIYKEFLIVYHFGNGKFGSLTVPVRPFNIIEDYSDGAAPYTEFWVDDGDKIIVKKLGEHKFEFTNSTYACDVYVFAV